MNKEYGIYAGAAVALIILAAGIWWITKDRASAPPVETAATSSAPSSLLTATSSKTTVVQKSPSTAASTPTKSPTSTSPAPFALAPGETVASWNFPGSYKDGGQLEASRNAIIADMKQLLNAGATNTYELNVSIANQYELLGDGQNEYTYLQKALALDSTKTGLAWHNMGKLLEKLGAYKSARVAYDHMIQVQLTKQYALARLEFLKAHMPEDTNAIAQAEADLSASTW